MKNKIPSTRGPLAVAELKHMRLRVELLEEALEATRDEDPATLAKLGYRVNRAIARLMGNFVSDGCDIKRFIQTDILGPILAPSKRHEDLLGKKELADLRKWLVSRPFMGALSNHWREKRKRRNA